MIKGIKYKSKISKGIKKIVSSAYNDNILLFFDELLEFQKLVEKIPRDDSIKYEKYLTWEFTSEINRIRVEAKRIEMSYKETLFKTNQKAAEFEEKITDHKISTEMRDFYQKEYLNILKPLYIIKQILENFEQYLEVIKITTEEINEWFFNGNIDFMKQLLKPFIVSEKIDGNQKETWVYKKYDKKMSDRLIEEMYRQAGFKK
ncbi:MAG: hypothetical protein FK734_17445 [Asgard group archaeon]|nr:hypothetical protein [Asgard group archaeon]